MRSVEVRRRTIKRLGLLTLVALAATACIFDKGDYQGGGRDLTVQTATATATDTTTSPTTTSTIDTGLPPQDSGGNPLQDALSGG